MNLRFLRALSVGKLNELAVNMVDRERGTIRAGSKALEIDPDFISHLKGIDPDRVLFVTGTNGKSTTNNLITHILRNSGFSVVSNVEGANLITGVAMALVKASDMGGTINADYYVFETDERYLGYIAEQLPSSRLLVTNLQKDQVQRNGDPDYIYRKITDVICRNRFRLILNADEPRSASLADLWIDPQAGSDQDSSSGAVTSTGSTGSGAVSNVKFYGAARHPRSFIKPDSFVTMPCPRCCHRIRFDYHNSDGIGGYHCDNCGYSNFAPDCLITDVDYDNRTFSIDGTTFHMPYDQPFMLYNYAAAVLACRELAGIGAEDAAAALETFVNVAGRLDSLEYNGQHIQYMRFKQENPETLQSFINAVAADPEEKVLVIGFGTVNDFDPHYINSSYAFDCDLSLLEHSNVIKYIFVTDTICYDAALSFIYGGVDPDRIEVIPTNDEKTILDAVAETGCSNVYMTIELHRFERMKAYAAGEVSNG